MHEDRSGASRRWGAVALAAVAAVAAGCGSDSGTSGGGTAAPASVAPMVRSVEVPAGAPQRGGQVTVALAAETDSFNPFASAWSASAYEVANAVFDPMTAFDDAGVVHPYLAESVTSNAAYTEWTIKVRPGVRFHDGTGLDAAAVERNLDAALAAPLTSQGLTAIEDVSTVDASTVRVKMKRPWSTFPAALAVQTGYVAAPAMLDDPAGAAAAPVGTGPFRYTDRQRNSFVKTVRNDAYWREAPDGLPLPYLDQAEFKVVPDAATRRAAMASGDVDAAMIVTPTELATATEEARRGEIQLITDVGQESDETVIGFNTTRLPFSDPNARKALQYGIDQKLLADGIFDGSYPGAWGMFEEDSPYYISKAEAGYPERDLDRARQLAEEYQRAHGAPLEFATLVPPDPQYLLVAQAFQAQAAEFGVKVNIEAIEQTTLLSRVVVSGDYEAAWFILWSSPSPDRSYIFLATKPNPTGLSLNFTRFDDPKITAALDAFRATEEQQARIDAITAEQRSLAENGQVLFMFHRHDGFAYNTRTHGMRGTTVPGTDGPAYAPYLTTPFLTSVWKS